jgi:hypothetical protein
LGLSGRVPARVDAATKAGLLDLVDEALEAGWTVRRACHCLELAERRAHRWLVRRARGRLADRAPGGSPMHGLLAVEAEQILALFDEWGETDRSHRKLAHRGSYLHRVWVSPSSVRRVLFLADKHFRPRPRPGKSVRKPFPDWVTRSSSPSPRHRGQAARATCTAARGGSPGLSIHSGRYGFGHPPACSVKLGSRGEREVQVVRVQADAAGLQATLNL